MIPTASGATGKATTTTPPPGQSGGTEVVKATVTAGSATASTSGQGKGITILYYRISQLRLLQINSPPNIFCSSSVYKPLPSLAIISQKKIVSRPRMVKVHINNK